MYVARQELIMESMRIRKEEIEEAKDLVKDETGDWITIETPRDCFDEVDSRSVLFRCIDRDTNKVKYSTPEEVQSLFQECWNQLEFSSWGVPYGMVELLFKTIEEAKNVATKTIETEKWLLLPNHL